MGADRTVGRRAFVTVAAGSLAGCGAVLGRDGRPVSMLAAGSLTNALENGLVPDFDVPVQVETHGSARVARLVASGSKDPDIVSLADPALFGRILSAPWYAEFATNEIVLAYDAERPGGRLVGEAGSEAWFRPLINEQVSVGRTDPNLDPLGYRTLFTLELATAHYDLAVPLHRRIPERARVYPETQLLARFETGAIEAAFVYRSMAEERGYQYVDLPAEIDLGDPSRADRYARTEYELPNETVIQGAPISYAATVRHRRPAVNRVFRRHMSGDTLRPFGFGVPDDYPRFTGDVPQDLT